MAHGPPLKSVARLANLFHAVGVLQSVERRDGGSVAHEGINRLDRLFDGLSALDSIPANNKQPKRFEQRGQGLIDYMNKCRAEKQALANKCKLSPKATSKLQTYNKRFARKKCDVVDIDSETGRKGKSKKVRGKSVWRRYVGHALARAAWGFPCRKSAILKSVRRKMAEASNGRKKQHRTSNRSACSTSKRNIASFLGDSEGSTGGHTHVSKVRKAVSEKCLQKAEANYKNGDDCDTKILELSLDETETPMRMMSRNETTHLCMMHGKEWRCFDDCNRPCQFFELVMAPAPLRSTDAECIISAVRSRLARYNDIPSLKEHCDRLSLMLNTDSAPACLRGGRGLGKLIRVLKLFSSFLLLCRCQTHQVVLSIVEVLRMCKLINGLYCFFTQMSSHNNLTVLRQILRSIMRGPELDIDYPGDDGHRGPDEFVASIIRLLQLSESNIGNAHVPECWNELADLLPEWSQGAF